MSVFLNTYALTSCIATDLCVCGGGGAMRQYFPVNRQYEAWVDFQEKLVKLALRGRKGRKLTLSRSKKMFIYTFFQPNIDNQHAFQ